MENYILNAKDESASVQLNEIVVVNDQVGLLVNKEEQENFKGPVSLDKYPIDNNV